MGSTQTKCRSRPPKPRSIDVDVKSSVNDDLQEEEQTFDRLAMADQGFYETEVYYEDEDEDRLHKYKSRCTKNPGHHKFIPYPDFTLQHLPPSHQQAKFLHMIHLLAQLTVRITVKRTCPSRPDGYAFSKYRGTRINRVASGYVYDCDIEKSSKNIPCPVEGCKESPHPHTVHGYIKIVTAAHVVYSNSEAVKAEIDFFYDDDMKANVIKAHGVRVDHIDVKGDFCIFECVTHDEGLLHWLAQNKKVIHRNWNKLHSNTEADDIFVVISHPHGVSKQVSVGRNEGMDPLVGHPRKCYKYSAATCPGSSGAPVWFLRHARFGEHSVVLPFAAPHSGHFGQDVNMSGREYAL